MSGSYNKKTSRRLETAAGFLEGLSLRKPVDGIVRRRGTGYAVLWEIILPSEQKGFPEEL